VAFADVVCNFGGMVVLGVGMGVAALVLLVALVPAYHT